MPQENELLKIIEIMILVGSIIIVAAGIYRQTFMATFSNWLQLKMFETQNFGNLTQAQIAGIETQLNDLDKFRYDQQQWSQVIGFFGFLLTTFSLSLLLVFLILKFKTKKDYLKKTIIIFLIIFLILWIWFLIAHFRFTF